MIIRLKYLIIGGKVFAPMYRPDLLALSGAVSQGRKRLRRDWWLYALVGAPGLAVLLTDVVWQIGHWAGWWTP